MGNEVLTSLFYPNRLAIGVRPRYKVMQEEAFLAGVSVLDESVGQPPTV